MNPSPPELLAPAGSLETFFAALDKGADAVYAGLKEFSARARAKNFTLAEMERMTAYAHRQGKRLYVTLNTIIKEGELPRLAEILSALESFGVDGVIVQDLAVARIVRRHFPAIPLHGSTQMTVHNSAGVKTLARLGFSRVVLARELTLEELRAVIAESPIEIECFIHGALCFSWSGQCYFSSFLGGHSGNRGRCTQPCRRLYRHQGREGYYFSTNDFSAIDQISDLRSIGVVSFKIEGRMKSAEYVATVVEAYRRVMDAPPDHLAEATREAKELLKRSFGRLPTKGFLLTKTPTDIAIPSIKGSTGRFVGIVTAYDGTRITVTTRERIHVGDRLRIQPKSDQAGTGLTVRQMTVGKRSVTRANPGETVVIPLPFPASRGDAVFKVSSETAYTLSEAACRRRLEGCRTRLPVDLTLRIDGEMLMMDAEVQGERCSISLPIHGEESTGGTGMEEVMHRHFSQTGDTPFWLRHLDTAALPSLFIPPRILKEVRRRFYDELTAAIPPRITESRARRLAACLEETRTPVSPHPMSGTHLLVRVGTPREWSFLNHEMVSSISLPISRGAIHSLDMISAKCAGREERVNWRFPLIIMEEELRWFREAIDLLISRGFRWFMLSNLGQFTLLEGMDVRITTDYPLFSLNSQAIRQWGELGAESVTLSIEDDHDNIRQLLGADLPVVRSVLLHAPIHLLSSRIPVKDARPQAPFTSDRGDSFRVSRPGGTTLLSASNDFSIISFRKTLQGEGCTHFQIDLSESSSDRSREVLEGYRTGRTPHRTVEGNFTRELV